MIFASVQELQRLIDGYFEHIKGEFHFEDIPDKNDDITRKKVWDRDAEPPTISGLIWYLGFDSRASFDAYQREGAFASAIKCARLRIEAEYEKKLHQQSPSGAIFALKNLGWNDRDNMPVNTDVPQSLRVEVFETGVPTATNEREVVL